MAVWSLGGPFFNLWAGFWASPQSLVWVPLVLNRGIVRATKKMTHIDNRPCPDRNYGEAAVFTFCRKAENGLKIRFFSFLKNTRNLLKDWYLFGKRVLPSLHNFAHLWLEHGFDQEVNVLFGPKNSDFGLKICFLLQVPGCCGWPVALGKSVDLTPSDQFFDFWFPSYPRFWEEKKTPDAPKSFPHPTAGAPSASNIPSALGALAGRND